MADTRFERLGLSPLHLQPPVPLLQPVSLGLERSLRLPLGSQPPLRLLLPPPFCPRPLHRQKRLQLFHRHRLGCRRLNHHLGLLSPRLEPPREPHPRLPQVPRPHHLQRLSRRIHMPSHPVTLPPAPCRGKHARIPRTRLPVTLFQQPELARKSPALSCNQRHIPPVPCILPRLGLFPCFAAIVYEGQFCL